MFKQFKLNQEIKIIICRLKDPSFVINSSSTHTVNQSLSIDMKPPSLKEEIINELFVLYTQKESRIGQFFRWDSFSSCIQSKNNKTLLENMIEIKMKSTPDKSMSFQGLHTNEEVDLHQPKTIRRGFGKTQPNVNLNTQYFSDSECTDSLRKRNKSFYSDISITNFEKNEQNKIASSTANLSVTHEQTSPAYYRSPINSHFLRFSATKSVSVCDFTGSMLAADMANFYRHHFKPMLEENHTQALESLHENQNKSAQTHNHTMSKCQNKQALFTYQTQVNANGREKEEARKLYELDVTKIAANNNQKNLSGHGDFFEIPIRIKLGTKKSCDQRNLKEGTILLTGTTWPKKNSSSIGLECEKMLKTALQDPLVLADSLSHASTIRSDIPLAHKGHVQMELIHPNEIITHESVSSFSLNNGCKNNLSSIKTGKELFSAPLSIEQQSSTTRENAISKRLTVEHMKEKHKSDSEFKSNQLRNSQQSDDVLVDSFEASSIVRLIKKCEPNHQHIEHNLIKGNFAKESEKPRIQTGRTDQHQRYDIWKSNQVIMDPSLDY